MITKVWKGLSIHFERPFILGQKNSWPFGDQDSKPCNTKLISLVTLCTVLLRYHLL